MTRRAEHYVAECELAREVNRRMRRIVDRLAPHMPITAGGFEGAAQMFDPERHDRRQRRKRLAKVVAARLDAKLRSRGFLERASAEFAAKLGRIV